MSLLFPHSSTCACSASLSSGFRPTAPPDAPVPLQHLDKMTGKPLHPLRHKRLSGVFQPPWRAFPSFVNAGERSISALDRRYAGGSTPGRELRYGLRRILEHQHALKQRRTASTRSGPALRPAARTAVPDWPRFGSVLRTCARNSLKVAPGCRRPRNTRVLAKKPISGSTSKAVRLAMTVPTAMSCWPQ